MGISLLYIVCGGDPINSHGPSPPAQQGMQDIVCTQEAPAQSQSAGIVLYWVVADVAGINKVLAIYIKYTVEGDLLKWVPTEWGAAMLSNQSTSNFILFI